MSAAPAPGRAVEATLAGLKSWRDALAEQIAAFRRWALVPGLLDEQASTRLAHLERRLSGDRLTIAFLSDASRGRRELINALFFADAGARLLPAGDGRTSHCPIELLWDAAEIPALRLLPIETRIDARGLREWMATVEGWKEIALDPTKPHLVATACEALAQTIEVSSSQAGRLGFAAGEGGAVTVPKWRFAVLNYPHPLLAGGIGLIDLSGQDPATGEPELQHHRLPEAAAIILLLATQEGVTPNDRALWNSHLTPLAGIESRVFVVLDQSEGARGEERAEANAQDQDRKARAVADELGIAPTRVFALSARQGLLAKMGGDRDALLRSRLYRLEQAIARELLHQRRLDHARAATAELRTLFDAARELIDGRISFASQKREELKALEQKNARLVETLARKAAAERSRLERARTVLNPLRTTHERLAIELGRLLAPAQIQAVAQRAQSAMAESHFSSGIGGAVDTFFSQARADMGRAVELIEQVKANMAEARDRFRRDCDLWIEAQAEFGTARFMLELERLERECRSEFMRGPSLLMQGRKTLGTRFHESVASQVIHVFHIADREVNTWMLGFIRPLEAQLNDRQEKTNARIEGMGRLQAAEAGLLARLDELDAYVREMRTLRQQCDAHEKRLNALLAVENELSLA